MDHRNLEGSVFLLRVAWATVLSAQSVAFVERIIPTSLVSHFLPW